MKNTEISLWQFSVIPKKLWIFLGAILNDSQWFAKNWNLFGTILGDSQWLLVICKKYWIFSGAILNDSQWFVKKNYETLILSDSQKNWNFWGWFSMILGDLQKKLWNLFGMILGDSQKTQKFLWGSSQWFTNHSEISQWFNIHYLEWIFK